MVRDNDCFSLLHEIFVILANTKYAKLLINILYRQIIEMNRIKMIFFYFNWYFYTNTIGAY